MGVLRKLLDENQFVLAEGARVERLRRHPEIQLDPNIADAALVRDDEGRKVLEEIYREYLDIGHEFKMPMVVLTPTWRASVERLEHAGLSIELNRDAADFVLGLRDSYGPWRNKVAIGGLMGCKSDAYHPATALPVDAAYHYHQPQAEALALSGVDFLIGSTLPAVTEATGMARAMAETGMPYIISFVVRAEGHVLDGTLLSVAMQKVVEAVRPGPTFFMVNCVHPANFRQAMVPMEPMPELRRRIVGLQANTSEKRHEELDGAYDLETEDPVTFGEDLASLYTDYGLRILGGCCGTDNRHIRALAESLGKQRFERTIDR